MRGVDTTKFGSSAYQEKLSDNAAKLRPTIEALSRLLTKDPDLENIGVMPGANAVVLYWSGKRTSPRLERAAAVARARGVGLVIAPRKVSKKALAGAERYVTAHRSAYAKDGIEIVAWGGFSSTFDGIEIYVDDSKTPGLDKASVRARLAADLGIPVDVSFGQAHLF